MDNKCRYTLIKCGVRSYFIGSNTGSGFRLSPDPGLREDGCGRMIIMKGGPGTGKSTIMKHFSNRAAAAGYFVTEYFCSSDPSSLDAVRAQRGEKSIVVCDGTAPHVTEMKYPGAVSGIKDLSTARDEAQLIPHREEIVLLTEKKKNCFAKAEASFRAAGVISGVAYKIGREAVNREKLNGFARRTAE